MTEKEYSEKIHRLFVQACLYDDYGKVNEANRLYAIVDKLIVESNELFKSELNKKTL